MPEYPNPIRIGNFYPPQVYNATKNEFEMLEGSDGAYKAQTIQTVSADYIEGTGNLTKEFTEDMHGLSIYNDSESIMRFTINGVSRPVFPKGSYAQVFKEPFQSLSVTASGQWYIDVLQQLGAAMSVVVPEPPDTTAPDNVTNLEYSNVTQNSVTLTFTASASSDTVGYEIWRGGSLLTTITGTSYNATGLSPSTQYTFTVKAKDAAGNVASGTSKTVTTIAQPEDTTPPANVTELAAGTPTQNSVTLSWQASSSSDVKDYRIYNGSTLIATVTGLTYAVTGLSPSTAYTFTVKARDNANNEASGASVTVTTVAPADTTPPVLTITPAGGSFNESKTVTMTTNETGSSIYYTTDGETTPNEYSTLYSSPITISATTTLKARAKDTAGNWSDVQTLTYTITIDPEEPEDTTPPDPVSDLEAGTPTANSIPLTWTKSTSSDVTAQEVAYSTDGSSFTVASASVSASATSYTVTGLTAETEYTIRVVAIDGAGNRSTPVTVQATTAEAEEPVGPVDDSSRLLFLESPASGTVVENPENYFAGTGDFTFVITCTTAKYAVLAGRFSSSSPNENVFKIERNGSDIINFFLYNSELSPTSIFTGATGATAVTDGDSRHFVVIRSDNYIKLYMDNALYKTSAAIDPSWESKAGNSTQQFKVGTSNITVKNVAYYNRALTTAEMTQNYNALK